MQAPIAVDGEFGAQKELEPKPPDVEFALPDEITATNWTRINSTIIPPNPEPHFKPCTLILPAS